MYARAILETLRELFFPLQCAGCGKAIESEWFCAACESSFIKIEHPRCRICSHPFEGAIEQTFVCTNCRGRAFHFDCAVATVRSRGVPRELVHRLKYSGEQWLRLPLADFLEDGLLDERLDVRIDGIVPVPLHPRRQREREFNQAALLAGELSKRRKIPVFHALSRVRYTTTQTHFDRRRRMQNLRDAFNLRQNVSVQGKNLLLVDDVLTTGSTLDECSRVLLAAGANSVRALTVARG